MQIKHMTRRQVELELSTLKKVDGSDNAEYYALLARLEVLEIKRLARKYKIRDGKDILEGTLPLAGRPVEGLVPKSIKRQEIKFAYLVDEQMWQVEMALGESKWSLGPYTIKMKNDGYHVQGVNLGTDQSPFGDFHDANNRVAEAILRNIRVEEGEPW